MHPMFRLAAAALALTLLAACGAPGVDSGGGSEGPPPWAETPTFGNFTVNSTSVTTHQDGVSRGYLIDYVNQSALPQTTLNAFAVRVYIPASDSYSTRLANVEVTAGFTDATRTGNIFLSGAFVERTTIDAQLYSVYELTANYNGSPSLSASNFANVVFVMTVRYLDPSTNDAVEENSLTVEIYKRQ